MLLQPLKPKEGRFLPVVAALGGLLFLAPEGHLPAQHDVLRLQHDGPSLPVLKQQQGYISCEPKPDVSVFELLQVGSACSCQRWAACLPALLRTGVQGTSFR